MSNARNLANFKPSEAGLVETNDITDLAITPAKLAQPLTSGTAQAATSGTTKDFTGIPSWAKRITVIFDGLSTNGSSNLLIQIGNSSFQTSGYSSFVGFMNNSTSSTAGFIQTFNNAGNLAHSGCAVLSLINTSSNLWVCNGQHGRSDVVVTVSSGSKTLSGVLDRVRITTVNGTDTFDAGTINILYE